MTITIAGSDDMRLADLIQIARAAGKRLRFPPIPPKPKDIPDGTDRRLDDSRPGRRVAGQHRQPGTDATR